jgi:GTP cyclohydrolase IA
MKEPKIVPARPRPERTRLTHPEEPGPAPEPFAEKVRDILTALGEDPGREGLVKTPDRVEASLRFLTQGYWMTVEEVIGDAVFEETHQSMIMVRDIELYSLCEHHLLPFFGVAHVAYVPGERIIGLSKLPRVVEHFARRLQVQERLTVQVADWLESELRPRGVGVVMEATHLCMSVRGVRQPGASTRTSALRGVMRDDPVLRAEFLRPAGGG